MGSFSKGFGHQLGKLSANAVGNKIAEATGLDQSSHVTHHSARDRYNQQRAENERRKLDFLQSDAILKNADMVREILFSDDLRELEHQVSNLHIQMKSERWYNVLGDDKRMNIFTDTLFAKWKVGVNKLEKMDPLNENIVSYKFYSYFCSWVKVFEKYFVILAMLIPISIAWILCIWEDLDNTHKIYVYLGVALYVVLRVYLTWRRQISTLMKKSERETSSTTACYNQPATDSPVDAAEVVVNEIDGNVKPAFNPLCHDGHVTLFEKYGSASPILQRGFRVCENKVQKDILIVGFNPSFVEDGNEGFEYSLPEANGTYWSSVNKMIQSPSLSLRHRAAYLDLFSFRETNQEVGEKDVVLNTQMFGYVVEQVSLIQNVIEDVIKPKVIVVKNKGAWTYFGINPQFTWMGYQYQYIEDLPCGKVYRITGFQASSERINGDRAISNIVGSHVIFTTHTDTERYPTPTDLNKFL